jgi:hypothetical protein
MTPGHIIIKTLLVFLSRDVLTALLERFKELSEEEETSVLNTVINP